MTREEALQILDTIPTIGEEVDALEMAIKALEQEPCEDCISRQQAIDKMQELENEDIKDYGCSIPEGFDGKRAIEALKALPSIQLKEVYQKGYKDGQEMIAFHLELCKEEQSAILEDIKAIINTPNTIIQEDVLKYKMICEVLKNEGYN